MSLQLGVCTPTSQDVLLGLEVLAVGSLRLLTSFVNNGRAKWMHTGFAVGGSVDLVNS